MASSQCLKHIKPSIKAICLADLLVSLGSPRAMETLSVLPAGLSTGKSESPAEKVRARVPPPPQPSFFTATVILKGTTETTGCQGNAFYSNDKSPQLIEPLCCNINSTKKMVHICSVFPQFYSSSHICYSKIRV